MNFKSLSVLNKTLLRNPFSNYAWLQLDNYLVVVADDEETDNFLIALEDNGHLPLTVSWFSKEGRKVRLYRRAEGFKNGRFFFFGLTMAFLTDSCKETLVASPLVRSQDYEEVGDISLLQNEPAALDEKALKIFQSMFFIADCFSEPEQ